MYWMQLSFKLLDYKLELIHYSLGNIVADYSSLRMLLPHWGVGLYIFLHINTNWIVIYSRTKL